MKLSKRTELVSRLVPRSRQEKAVALVFGAGIVVRMLFMIAYRPALLGIPDSGTYIAAAHQNLFLDQVHPAGYAVFLRILHGLSGHLSATTAVQHALGVGAAIALYELVRRTTGSRLAGLVPAIIVLFNGLELFVEHSPLSDVLFVLLTALTLLVTVAAREGRIRWLVLVGVLLSLAVTVRTVAVWLLPLVALWLLLSIRRAPLTRLAMAAVPLITTVLLTGAYVIVQRSDTGVTGLTQADGRFVYAIAAQFADCKKFTPPPGTQALCETSPPDSRGSMNQYLEGYPDPGSQLPLGNRAAVSPAWRVFGPIPRGNAKLGSFGRAAILHQPFDYLGVVARNFHYYWSTSPQFFLDAAARPDPGIESIVAGYYATGRGVSKHGFGAFRSYARSAEVDGLLIALLLLCSLTGPIVREPRARQAAILLGAAGWLLLLGAAMVHEDPRYTLPAVGPLAGAAAIGVSDLYARIVTRLRPVGHP